MSGALRLLPQLGVAPSAICIFSFVQNGIRVTEAGVPDVLPTSSFRLYTERGAFVNGRPLTRSGLAIVNSGAMPVDVTIELTDENGAASRITGLGPPNQTLSKRTLQIAPMSHVAMFEDEIFPGLPEGARFMRVSSREPVISVIGLRGRYNERGDFLITTTPAIPEDTNPDSRPLYIPHFVNGGGYTTQFILFGASAQSVATSLSVTTEYFNQTGAPIVVPSW